MNIYQCPKCATEFTADAKFCQNCGCNLKIEFIETPTCQKCGKTFSACTKFCDEDGTKLVSPEKLTPRCIKCGRVYTDGTKFCPEDGGQIISETLQNEDMINNDNGTNINKSILGKIALGLAITAALIDVYIILHYFSFSGTWLIGGFVNAFPLYLKYEVMGWIIFAIILSGIAKFIDGVVSENNDKISETGSLIASLAGGLAVIFLIVGLLSRVITGF